MGKKIWTRKLNKNISSLEAVLNKAEKKGIDESLMSEFNILMVSMIIGKEVKPTAKLAVGWDKPLNDEEIFIITGLRKQMNSLWYAEYEYTDDSESCSIADMQSISAKMKDSEFISLVNSDIYDEPIDSFMFNGLVVQAARIRKKYKFIIIAGVITLVAVGAGTAYYVHNKNDADSQIYDEVDMSLPPVDFVDTTGMTDLM